MKKILPLLSVSLAFAADPSAPMPADVAAMLEAHVGTWKATGWIMDEKGKKNAEATWECHHPGKGPGLQCAWHHQWPDGSQDTEFEMVGYDPESGQLRFSRLREDGSLGAILVEVTGKTMHRRWEFTKDGKKGVGENHIEVRESGRWEQLVTVELDGKRTFEMSVTQRRTDAAAGGAGG